MNIDRLIVLAVCSQALVGLSAELPPLVGDGVADDTAAIQARLDSGLACVYLPPPRREYLISRTLRIGSGQELRLDRYARIRLASWSNCPMVGNRDQVGGNHHVTLTGGIWDYDNVNQKCNPSHWKLSKDPDRNKPENIPGGMRTYDARRYLGVAMSFINVREFAMRGLTVRNPSLYATHFCHLSYFTIDDIEFDFTAVNPAKANMDGIHLDGNCHHGRISNLRGCCFDDTIALNANDGGCAAEEGPITDIDIDGVYAEYSHTAVRILSARADCPVKRVTIRNVHGNFYRYTVGLTRFFHERPGRGVIDDIVIENCFSGSAPWPDDLQPPIRRNFCHMPIIFCDNGVDIGDLTVKGFHRIERHDPVPTISIGGGTTVRNLIVRDCVQENRTDRPLIFLLNRGRVARQTIDNVALYSGPGAAGNVLATTEKIWTDKGHVVDLKATGKPVDGYYPDALAHEEPGKDPCP